MKGLKAKIFGTGLKIKNIISVDMWNYFQKDSIFLYYSDFNNNWGDAVNPYIINKITGKKVISSRRVLNLKNRNKLFGVGSILNAKNSDLEKGIIWGSGFLKIPEKDFEPPKQILAVRGKLTGEILSRKGLSDPGIYGDPALLFPSFYNPKVKKKYKLGIVPHYTEVNEFLNNKKLNENKDVNVITPIVSNGDYLKIIDQIKECENVISSSLHGLILADAYGIPSLRFKFGSKILGGDFKYQDYYSGVGVKSFRTEKIKTIDTLNVLDITDKVEIKQIKFDSQSYKNALLDHLQST